MVPTTFTTTRHSGVSPRLVQVQRASILRFSGEYPPKIFYFNIYLVGSSWKSDFNSYNRHLSFIDITSQRAQFPRGLIILEIVALEAPRYLPCTFLSPRKSTFLTRMINHSFLLFNLIRSKESTLFRQIGHTLLCLRRASAHS